MCGGESTVKRKVRNSPTDNRREIVANDKVNALLDEIGQLLAADRASPLEPTLLYAQLDDNMIGESIFKEMGNQILYRRPINRRLPFALL